MYTQSQIPTAIKPSFRYFLDCLKAKMRHLYSYCLAPWNLKISTLEFFTCSIKNSIPKKLADYKLFLLIINPGKLTTIMGKQNLSLFTRLVNIQSFLLCALSHLWPESLLNTEKNYQCISFLTPKRWVLYIYANCCSRMAPEQYLNRQRITDILLQMIIIKLFYSGEIKVQMMA